MFSRYTKELIPCDTFFLPCGKKLECGLKIPSGKIEHDMALSHF